MSSNNQPVVVSVPGSVMLLGEHAVLRDHPALVAAVNYRIKLTYVPRNDQKIIIRSNLGEREYQLAKLAIEPPFQFILSAIQLCLAELKHGFELKIESEFSHQVGLGSSAAVTVATIAVLQKIISGEVDLRRIWQLSQHAVRAVQGSGSGADVAASVYGGVVYYQQEVGMIEHSSSAIPLGLVYSGAKTPTAEVIRIVQERFKDNLDQLAVIDSSIAQCVKLGITAIREYNWPELGEIFSKQQFWMRELGVCHQPMQEILQQLAEEESLFGAKISGSGLGDSVIFVGKIKDSSLAKDERYIPIEISPQGIMFLR